MIPSLMRRMKETQSESVRKQYAHFIVEQAVPRARRGARLRPEGAVRSGSAVRRLAEIAAKAHRRRLPLRDHGRARQGTDAMIGSEQILKEVATGCAFSRDVGLGLPDPRAAQPPTLLGRRVAAHPAREPDRPPSLRGVLYILDEPSIGLHPSDNQRLLSDAVALARPG